MEESEYSGTFDPNEQMALLYIADGRIAGFLSWNEPVQFQVLRQLYVQPEARRRGFAEALVRRWIERYCRNDVYFLDQPNDSSRSLFARLDDELALAALLRESTSLFNQSTSNTEGSLGKLFSS
jgi:ribosomal protein S18 acetylase RimI-like enzyme